MTVRDVVVVGAGPAGSTLAAVLARRGRDVLLLDRAPFPRDKPCGDGIPPGTVSILNRLGMGEALRAAGFHSIRGLRLVSPRGHDWSAGLRPRDSAAEFYIAPRAILDDLIRRHALSLGAEFRVGAVKSLLVDRGAVCGLRVAGDGAEHTIRARVVAGADGATSQVARSLLGDKPPARARGVAIRAYASGIETIPHTIEFHWYARYAPGYAWIFPQGPDAANVGVVVRADAFKRRGISLDGLLDDFLRAPDLRARAHVAELRERATWQLPYATPRAGRRTFDGALLVGDAARLVDPLTGEGIHNAVVSACIAADVIDAALARGDTSAAALAAYDARCRAELGGLIRRADRAQRWLAAHPRAVEALLILMRAGSGPVARLLNRSSTDFEISAAPV